MPDAPNITTYSKIAISQTNPPTTTFEYQGGLNFGKRGVVMETGGTRGTRSHVVERTRNGIYTVGGVVNLQPGPAELDILLPLIAGGSKSTNTIPLAETLPYFYVGIDKRAQQYLYDGCKVASATFSGSQGNFLNLALAIEGKTETPGTITGLSASVPSLATPYVFHDAAITIGGTTYYFKEFSHTLDNGLILDRFMNSVTRTDIPEGDRHAGISLSHPFTADTLALYDTGVTSAAVVITLTNGSLFFKITMPAVQFPALPPDMPGRNELLLPLNGVARKTGSTAEVSYDNKSS